MKVAGRPSPEKLAEPGTKLADADSAKKAAVSKLPRKSFAAEESIGRLEGQQYASDDDLSSDQA